MKLQALLERLEYRQVSGTLHPEQIDISDVASDSRKAGPGSIFVCIEGANSDGHDYICDVAGKGTSAILVRAGHPLPDAGIPDSVAVIETEDTRIGLAAVSAAFYGYPSEQIPVIGITGTKGKTTSTYMIRSILEHAGYRVGLIGTIESIIGDRHIHSSNTTPESCVIQQYLREMIDAGMNCAVMEVSSQALMMHRTDFIRFEIGVFTNLSPDHIGPNEHASFEEYLACKGLLFRQCALGIINADDPHAEAVIKGHTCELETFSIDREGTDYRASEIVHVQRPGYLGMKFRVEGKKNLSVELDVPGSFSVMNALTAVAVCNHFRISDDDILSALKSARVKGRIEPVKVSDEFSLMIDYAHNAMALESLLTTLRDYHPSRIVCVFGCGGNRARSRRFEMGEVSGRLADLTIITSDNPRFEEPQAIIDDIITGIEKTDGNYIAIPDRKEAIAYAIRNGLPGDVIVLAGKGHEDYQEIRGVKYPMDERVLIREILDEETVR